MADQEPNAAVVTADPRAVSDFHPRELRELSFQERTAIQEEMHGVRNMIPTETPELLQQSLHGMQEEILSISTKEGYDTAQQLAPTTYANDGDCRLRFLRCELLDAKKTATRFVTFLDFMFEQKGTAELMALRKLSALTSEELEYLKEGKIQLLPFRDRSGRRIVAIVNDFGLKADYSIRVGMIPADDIAFFYPHGTRQLNSLENQ